MTRLPGLRDAFAMQARTVGCILRGHDWFTNNSLILILGPERHCVRCGHAEPIPLNKVTITHADVAEVYGYLAQQPTGGDPA
jgi:hypothetical protein